MIDECPHCHNATDQRPITDEERRVPGRATLEVQKRPNLNKCPKCGCIYGRETRTKLTFD
jgi:hypothetical protein